MKKLVFVAMLFCLTPAFGAEPGTLGIGPIVFDEQQTVIAEWRQYPLPVSIGDEVNLGIRMTVTPGYHINSHTPLEEYLIPTDLTITETSGIRITGIEFPTGELKNFAFSESGLSVYEKTVYLVVRGTVFSGDTPSIGATLKYQPCNDQNCFQPQSVDIAYQIITGSKPAAGPRPEWLQPANATAPPPAGIDLRHRLRERGLVLFLLLLFVQGLALNLTPCVYPMIPITVSIFTAGGEKKGIADAMAYFLGIILVFSLLGIAASFSGSIFGSLLQQPAVLIAMALLMVYLALGSFEIVRFNLPGFISRLTGKTGQVHGLAGSLLMGMSVGIAAAPCIGPFIIGLIVMVASSGSVLRGFLYFLATGAGLGLPYLFLALFANRLKQLPKSGDWLLWVKKIFGFILLGLALYFIRPLINECLALALMALLLAAAGIYLGFIDRTGTGRPVFTRIKYLVGIALIMLALLTVWRSYRCRISNSIWNPASAETLSAAERSGKPVLMDFYADWCIPCHELDAITFSDKRVKDRLNDYYLIKVDLTLTPDGFTKQLVEQYGVKGVPTILLFQSGNLDVPRKQLTGFIKPEQFIKELL